ncbi:MAG: hypothetical protein NVSMB21_15850 [Vulcanimicrobiaceae bacterium]
MFAVAAPPLLKMLAVPVDAGDVEPVTVHEMRAACRHAGSPGSAIGRGTQSALNSLVSLDPAVTIGAHEVRALLERTRFCAHATKSAVASLIAACDCATTALCKAAFAVTIVLVIIDPDTRTMIATSKSA